MADLVFVGISVLGCLAIVGYATWLLIKRIGTGGTPIRSVGQWIRQVFEGFMGL